MQHLNTSTIDELPNGNPHPDFGAIEPTSDQLEKADPYGLIASYLRVGPPPGMAPHDVFVLWLVSLQKENDAAMAARAVVDIFGAALDQAKSAWHSTLLAMFSEAAGWPDHRLRRVRRFDVKVVK